MRDMSSKVRDEPEETKRDDSSAHNQESKQNVKRCQLLLAEHIGI